MDFLQSKLSGFFKHQLDYQQSSNALPDYVALLPRLLPASIAHPAITLITSAFGILRTLQSHLSPLLTRIITQPDVASILALLAILFISLKILDMAYRAVMFWVKLAVRIVVWGGMAAVGFWVWNRGVDGFAEDVQDLGAYWFGEYERFKGEAKGWQKQGEAQVKANARRQGNRGWR